ncbi:MAG: hypothetical protein AB1714_12545 [Acidobacteriota bacterium]
MTNGESRYARELAADIETRIAMLREAHSGVAFDRLRSLPDFYRLLWHLAFDMGLPHSVRHYAGSLAFYVFSCLDYIAEATPVAQGYMDDLAVSVRGLRRIELEIGAANLARHWKGTEPLDQVLASSESLLAEFLPDRVDARVSEYLKL